MRLIFKDWTYSIEFDGTALSVKGNVIIAEVNGRKIELAVYENHDRAVEVFQEMHKEWAEKAENPLCVFELPEV